MNRCWRVANTVEASDLQETLNELSADAWQIYQIIPLPPAAPGEGQWYDVIAYNEGRE